jgi:ketosteroid isomerase-like protein
MKVFCGVVLAVGLLTGASALPAEPAAPAVSREHRATLDDYREAQVRAYLAGKPEPLLIPLADTVRLMPGYQKTVLGKADAATYHRAFLRRFDVRAYERQAIEAVDLGARVIEIGRFTITLSEKTPAASGTAEPHTLAGKYMDIWEKDPAGKLALHTAGWNYDAMPRIADRLRFADVPSVHIALQPRAPVTGGVSLEIAALGKLQESAIIQRDGKTWALFYADDAIQLMNQGAVTSGREALDAYFRQHARALPVFEKLDIRADRIDDLGKYAIEYGSAVVTWKTDDYSGVSLGKNIIVWRRADSGTLQIWRAISMYD